MKTQKRFLGNFLLQRKIELVVWDLPLRIYHWLLVIGIFGAFITSEWDDRNIHQFFGMAVLGLCMFRLVWGFIGSPSARFVSFINPPNHVIEYVKQILAKKNPTEAGHSPLGGWATIALILITSWFAVTGSFSNDGILFEGPYSHLLPSASMLATKLHKNAEFLLLIIILTHLAAIAFYYFWAGQNLVAAMIHGKRDEKEGPGGEISLPHTLLGLGLLSLCLLGAFLSIILKPSIF